VVQGLILSAVLIYSTKKIISNFYIGAFIFVVSESTLLMEMDYAGIWQHSSWLLIVLPPLTMALGPLIYLYARSLIFAGPASIHKTYIHFVPVIFFMKYQSIFLLYITGLLFIPRVSNLYVSAPVQNFLFGSNSLGVILAFLSVAIYTAFTYRMILSTGIQEQSSANKQIDLKWLKKLLQLIAFLIMIWFISIIISLYIPRYFLEPWFHYFLYIPPIIFAYWLGMAAYLRQTKMAPEDIDNYNKPVARRYYEDAEADKYWQQLKAMMETEKIYLDSSLKLEGLAARLNLPEKSVSSLLNQYLHKNFNDLVNEYRVEEAKKRLADPAFNRFTIASIAFDCGFNSLATFQRCFKQFTGITPSKYQAGLTTHASLANNTQIPI
jgi:AraC-like DNA-binding protein